MILDLYLGRKLQKYHSCCLDAGSRQSSVVFYWDLLISLLIHFYQDMLVLCWPDWLVDDGELQFLINNLFTLFIWDKSSGHTLDSVLLGFLVCLCKQNNWASVVSLTSICLYSSLQNEPFYPHQVHFFPPRRWFTDTFYMFTL